MLYIRKLENNFSIKETLVFTIKEVLKKYNLKNDVIMENKNLVSVKINIVNCLCSFDFDIIEKNDLVDVLLKNIKLVLNDSHFDSSINLIKRFTNSNLINGAQQKYVFELIRTLIPMFFDKLLDDIEVFNKSIYNIGNTFDKFGKH